MHRPIVVVGKVGDDEFGSRLRNGLRAAGVKVRAVATAKGTASGVALISLDRKGQNRITVVPGANGRWLPRDLEKARLLLRSAGMIMAQLEIPLETVEYLCTAAGDAFNGGLAVALMQGKNLEEAVRFGAAVAALSVTRIGAQPLMPTARAVSVFSNATKRGTAPEKS